jgi:transglutaminase-like putative cysteine protease
MTVPVLSGTVSKLVMMLGKPTSDTFQSVISDTATGPQTLAYPVPYPVFEKVMTNVAPGNYSLSQTFKVAVSNVATNLSLINTTWAQEDLAKQQLYHYAGPELNVETTDPTIIAFTNASLPPNYRTVLTPLQVAEKLFSAVVQAIAYKTPANGSAKVTLATKVGDCGSMTDLYNACLRVAGIPARTVCGWDNTNSTHCWTEMNFGGIGWIPADTSFARLTSPACTYMPFFGYLPTANQHCAVCRAGTLTTADMSTGAVQVGALSYTAGTPTPTVGPMTWNVILGTTPLP